MPSWTAALSLFVSVAAPVRLDWMLVGSAATALHGVTGIVPGDVDILVHPDTDDAALDELARRLGERLTPVQVDVADDLDRFVSTPRQPLLRSAAWTFGRWAVDGAKLEVARIRDAPDGGPLETHGRTAWAHRRTITWRGTDVPTVPLEVQRATMIVRGQADRLDAVAARVAEGLSWDAGLAAAALVARGLDPDEHALPSPPGVGEGTAGQTGGPASPAPHPSTDAEEQR